MDIPAILLKGIASGIACQFSKQNCYIQWTDNNGCEAELCDFLAIRQGFSGLIYIRTNRDITGLPDGLFGG